MREDIEMAWLPGAIVGALVIAVLAVSIGLVRHDPRRTIALNAVGYALFLIGLGVASEVSMEAFWAAGAASLGTLLFTMADQKRHNPFPTGR
jgi:EamA domain-containing membrane protein RarD